MLLDAEPPSSSSSPRNTSRTETGWADQFRAQPARHQRRKAAGMTQPGTALVIGGGIAGPVAAMAPTRRHPGHRVRGPPPRRRRHRDLPHPGLQRDRRPADHRRRPARGGGRVSDPGDPAAQHHRQAPWARPAPSACRSQMASPSPSMKRADSYQAIRDEATARGIVVEHGKRSDRRRTGRRWGAGGVRRRLGCHRGGADRRRRCPSGGPPADRPGRARPHLCRPDQPGRQCQGVATWRPSRAATP